MLPVQVSIIVVNWRSQAAVRRCLGSIWQQTRRVRFEVIVVDNASADGCGAMLAAEFPSVRLFQNETNVGWVQANNLGLQQAAGRQLLFLHPDTVLIENSVEVMARELDLLTGAGAVGCNLLNADRSTQASCVRAFPTLMNQVLDAEYLHERFPDAQLWGRTVLQAKWPRPAQVDVVSGACLMVRRDAFERLGGFNPAFFVCGGELDLCFRLKCQGTPAYYLPQTSVIHLGGTHARDVPGGITNVMVRESVFRFMLLHRGPVQAYGFRVAMTLTALLRLALIPPLLPMGKVVVRHGRGSWTKWMTILRWSVGHTEKR